MRARLLNSMLLVAAIAIVGFGVPLAISVQSRELDGTLLVLSEEAARAAVAVPGSFVVDNDLPELPTADADISTALYDRGGLRIVGAGPDRADGTVEAALASGAVRRDRARLTVALPVSYEESVVGAIRTSIPVAIVQQRVRRTWLGMGLLALAVLTVAGGIAALRSRRLSRPLWQLHADAAVIGAGGRMPSRSSSGIGEIDAVHAALADAATRLGEAMLRERSFSADAAHQLRTPLASLRLRLETEQQRPDHDRELLEDALRDVDRLERTIGELLGLARDTQRRHEPRPLATMLRDRVAHWQPRLADLGRRLDVEAEAHLPFVAESPPAIGQILDVLVDNALCMVAGRSRSWRNVSGPAWSLPSATRAPRQLTNERSSCGGNRTRPCPASGCRSPVDWPRPRASGWSWPIRVPARCSTWSFPALPRLTDWSGRRG